MKKIAITFLILLLLLSTVNYACSESGTSSNNDNELNLDDKVTQKIDLEIQIENNDINPKPMASRALANSPWPMFHHDINHSGQSQYNTSANPGQLVWSYNTFAPVQSSPSIGSDGTIYVGFNGGSLFAITPDGEKKWQCPLLDDVRSSPAISSNGTIYVGSWDDHLYAIDPDGTKLWKFDANDRVWSSPAIDPNGTIYVGSGDHNLYAIYPNGTEKWSYQTLDWIRSAPAIGPNGTVYVNSNGLHAVNPDGSLKWMFSTGGLIEFASPLIGPDGIIYTVSLAGKLYAIYPNGTEKWSSDVGVSSHVSPAIGSDDTIYVGSYLSEFWAIYPNGTKKWTFKTDGSMFSSPAIGSDGSIYVGSNKKLYAIHPNGTEKWNFTTGALIRSSPAIGADGTVYVGSDDGKLYAIGMLFNLTSDTVAPFTGYTDTSFNYTVNYLHVYNKAPTFVNVSINGINNSMKEVNPSDINYSDGKKYYFNTTLNISLNHTFQFNLTLDNGLEYSTKLINAPDVYNTKPIITSLNNVTAYEDMFYSKTYAYEDVDIVQIGQLGTWNYSTNATWLSFNPTTATLSGTPTNDDVGNYWVNISINDTIDLDFTNFTLVVMNVNDDPVIDTTNIMTTYEDELYSVDYNATDIDSIISNQIWSLDTNATSWLDIDSNSGIISGTPTNDEVGEYWVNVSVDDGDIGLDFTNFILTVINVNDRPEIITEDELVANVDIEYIVDYDATDIDSPISQLTWSLTTNATWLDLETSTGLLSGTPTYGDIGWYNVNISVDDGDGGEDWHEFVLTVTTEGFENNPPEIITIDMVSISAGESYNIVYEATDDRTPVDSLIWSYNSNASWLSFNKITRTLSGNPTLSHLGWYWVIITVNDGEGGSDSHNFTLTVWGTVNQPPNIITKAVKNAVVGELYSVDYEAEDDRTPDEYLRWAVVTNATWLGMDSETGILSGTPTIDDLGWYPVTVSVTDGEDGWDNQFFVLYVTTEPLTTYPPELSNPSMTPTSGDTNTEFTFSVDYNHPDGDLPDTIQVVIDSLGHDMTSINGHYEYKTKLSEGNHTYYFTTKLGEFKVDTDTFNTGFITKAEGQPDDGDREDGEDNTMLYVLLGIIVVIIVALILLFIFLKKKKVKEYKVQVEEPPPPPSEEIPPPETSIADTGLTNLRAEEPVPPPPEQPPVPEAPPKEPLQEPPTVPETPPEQLPPTTEVTPQITQPQVEPQVEPAPVPQVEEPPVSMPQVEEPPQQPPVPKIKIQPKINSE